MFSSLLHTGGLKISHLLVYMIAPLLGAALAVAFFHVIRSEEYHDNYFMWDHRDTLPTSTWDTYGSVSEKLTRQSAASASVPITGSSHIWATSNQPAAMSSEQLRVVGSPQKS